ncbi:hydroxymethylpyrimidine/phosphomethylpyrimidine kinase [Flavobacterium sp. WLB]|uniref:hydroxymethylpyrimidine/phosphomethylpyrimidine kinase n=1 Tax=Flavobacterium TaxID=237 RepID=UPI0006AB8B95|nr:MULTISPECIES: hydroxymethylpyrimidine/phosphomethylpyrimidine kinase [Flavobacterium]KOP37629.1 phosphomethylpyrimidine kinase [Flavobacterium sp. VMW]OWU91260.1 phosphomethylpyrimidine kinase [Flavobacterium sp. NLM]PUU71305.1 hydroxymethylpyrimidine/phosphomethylpyrimidine kinase [Flavobacterium sp. WLB]UUF16143.1 hydroxymethylpyrimidine/phosphomethylpyrimidine kinase [Flavobacterium panici]
MSANRPFVLTIAGLDPSGGAGILADIKTFEQHKVTGFAITTANTIQTENTFYEIQWTDLSFVIRSIETLFLNYKISAVKIGIISSLYDLNRIVSTIKMLSPSTKIVWDPVLRSTTKFEFMAIKDYSDLHKILSKIDLITPNYNEIEILFPDFISKNLHLQNEITTNILLKGGHNESAIGTDLLFLENEVLDLLPTNKKCFEKHGSGCVLSSAIASNLALNQNITEACKNAKIYIENYLSSSSTLIGYHYV